jgi:nucleoside-diphosphate-sugar epimerase
MRVLMTGSSGFIGRYLRSELELRGHDVVGYDRVLDPAVSGPDVKADVSWPGDFVQVLNGGFDLVLHLAAQVGREFGEDDVAATIRDNAVGTALVARACGEAGVPVLYTSTSEVYGDLGEEVAREFGRMELPHNLYGVSKRWGEEVLMLYAPEGLRIARLSMPYGPGAPPGRGRRAMDNFLHQAHWGMRIPVHEGAARSWCWVGDTVRALRLIAESDLTGVWNVGRDDDERPLIEVAEMACDIAGATRDLIDIVPAPERQTVVKRLSTERLRWDFGWRPEVELEEGMEAVYDWIVNFDRQGRWIG